MSTTKTLVGIVAASLAVWCASSHRPACAAPPNDPPPADNRPDAPPPPGPENGPRPRGGPRELQRAIDQLDLPADKKQAAHAMVDGLRQKEQQAREELMTQLKAALTPDQFQKFQALIDQPPPPGGPGEREQGRSGGPERGRPTGPRPGAPAGGPQESGSRASGSQAAQAMPAPAAVAIPAKGVVEVPVTFTGGYETDPRDGGRPIVLIAAALGVPDEVFRKAFSGVTPAHDAEPEPAQVRLNKQALMKVLEPYGITNDRLDAVSNQYRYKAAKGQMWRTTPAAATATVRDGVVTGFTITSAGAGYSSKPSVSIPGLPDVKAEVTLSYGKDFAKNGSIAAIKIGDQAR